MINYLLTPSPSQDGQPNQSTSKNTSDVRCAKCNCATTASSPGRITFNKKFYHHDYFVCALCSKSLSGTQESGFSISSDGHPQCSQCDLARAKSCHACIQLVSVVNIVTSHWLMNKVYILITQNHTAKCVTTRISHRDVLNALNLLSTNASYSKVKSTIVHVSCASNVVVRLTVQRVFTLLILVLPVQRAVIDSNYNSVL